MFSRYPRVQTLYPPQSDQRELVSFSSSYHDDGDTHNDAGNHYKLQQGHDGYKYAAEFPTSSYPISQMESSSWNSPTSSDLHSNITLSDFGFTDNCNGLRGNSHDSLIFSSRSDFIQPPTNLSLVSKDVPADLYVTYNSMVLPTVLDDSFAMSKLPEPGATNQTVPLGSASFDSLDNIAMWNDCLLSSADDSLIVAHAGQFHLQPLTLCKLLTSSGPWNMTADGGNAHVMGVDFVENVDGDALNMDILLGYMPSQQSDFQIPAQPAEMTMGYDLSKSSRSHMCTTSSDEAPLFQFEPSWNLQNQEHEDESPSYSFLSSPPLWKPSRQSHKTISTGVNYSLYEVGLNSLAQFPKPRTTRTTGDLPILKPKPTLSSLGAITGRDSNTAISLSSKKPGRRNGPLDAEGRKGASQMRRDRACIACKLRKSRVS
jgi:hypothetical protein